MIVHEGSDAPERGRRVELLQELFAGIGSDESAAGAELVAIRRTFQQCAATVATKMINEQVAGSRDPATFRERQEVANAVERLCAELDLAVIDPQSGKPATLVASTNGTGNGWYVFIVPSGRRDGFLANSMHTELPSFTLAPAEPGHALWVDRFRSATPVRRR